MARAIPACLVEHAAGLPADDSGWSLAFGVEPEDAEECIGSLDGSATLTERSGTLLPPGGDDLVEMPELLSAGRLVRLLVEDADGTIERAWYDGRRTYTAIWWGVVRESARELTPQRAARRTWRCDDLLSILGRIPITTCVERSTTTGGAATSVTSDQVPRANARIAGDRSSSQIALDATYGSRSTYLFDRRSGASAARWRARDLAEYLLVLASFPWPYGLDAPAIGLDWRLGTGAELLEYDCGEQELEGRDVLSLLRSLAAPARGLCFTRRISGSTIYLDCASTAATAITIGGTTIPARTGTALDASSAATDAIYLEGPELLEDQSAADIIRVRTRRGPLCAITLAYIPGSTTCALQLADSTAPVDPGDDDPATEYRWRNFTLRPAWDGRTWNQTTGGLRTPDQNDFDGNARAWDSTMPPREALRLERLLPYGLGGATTGEQQPAFAMINSLGANAWELLSRMQVSLAEDGSGLILGNGPEDARYLASLLGTGSGCTLLVTVAIREWTCNQLAWTRPRAQWPNPVPRIIERVIDAEEWFAYQGTVTGINQSTLAPTIEGSDRTIQSATDALQQTLALLVARHGDPGATCAWRDRGRIDHASTYAPGAWLPSVTSDLGSHTVNAIISRRRWRFRLQGHGTDYSTERPALDPDAFRR